MPRVGVLHGDDVECGYYQWAERAFGKTRLCNFFQNGHCRRNSQCSFAHGEEELTERPSFSRTKMCRYVVDGGVCRMMHCDFAHSRAELRQPGIGSARGDHDGVGYPQVGRSRVPSNTGWSRSSSSTTTVLFGSIVPAPPRPMTPASTDASDEENACARLSERANRRRVRVELVAQSFGLALPDAEACVMVPISL